MLSPLAAISLVYDLTESRIHVELSLFADASTVYKAVRGGYLPSVIDAMQ
jgi:hypothetical protein